MALRHQTQSGSDRPVVTVPPLLMRAAPVQKDKALGLKDKYSSWEEKLFIFWGALFRKRLLWEPFPLSC